MAQGAHERIDWGGYFPGVIGKIVGLHAVYYHEHWGFDISFETQVGRELSEFMSRFRQGRDFFLAARTDSDLVGSIAIDAGGSGGQGARLRWFIVHPDYQGIGVGRRLLDQAVSFCRGAGMERVFLWTFQGLDAARSLYESAGFRIVEENSVHQWGQRICEQRFELTL